MTAPTPMPVSASVPVSAFAVAADVATRCLGEPLADLFDESAPSRARLIAIAATIEIYPGAARGEIARCFGLTASGHDLARMLAAAQSAAWWRRADVDRAIEKIRASLGRIRVADLLNGRARIVSAGPARRANPTAALMGDPPPGRREWLARQGERE